MKIQVGVFFGGKSVEHEVSVISAMQVAAAMDPDKYDAIPVYITKDNEMYTGPDLLTPAYYRDLPALIARSQKVVLVREKGKVSLLRYPQKLFTQPVMASLDLAFPVIHGTNGEDGSLQGFFQLYGLPYVGSDVGASASGMDKWVAKCLLSAAGLPVLPGFCFGSAEYQADREAVLDRVEGFNGYPLIVKPVNLGSSVGISPAHDRKALAEGVDLAASFAQRVLVEPMLLDMREINCAVMGDGGIAEASACEEPLSSGEILSYGDKYMASESPGGSASEGGLLGKSGEKGMGGARRILPAELDPGKEAQVKDLAQKAFRALCCSGVARVDFLMDRSDGKVYVNEINTIPGSLSFYLWEAAGKSFRQLTEDLIQMALMRRRIQEKLIWSNEANLLSGGYFGSKRSQNGK